MASGFGFQRYAEAARLICISESTVRRGVSKGLVAHYKISKEVFFDPLELRSYFEAHHVQAMKGQKNAGTKR